MSNFSELINGNKPVLVDFYAEWCGPCKMMKPELEELKQMMGEEAIILKVDVDKNPGAAQVYQIRGVPTLMVFKNGKVMWKQSGVVRANELKNVLKSFSS